MSRAAGQCHNTLTVGPVGTDPKTMVYESPTGASDPSHLS